MADHAHSTPASPNPSRPFRTAVRVCQRNVAHARAHLRLEDAVCNACVSAVAAESFLTDAWTSNPTAQATLGLGEHYRVIVLTDDQFEVIAHLMSSARDAAEALHKAYYAGLETAGARV